MEIPAEIQGEFNGLYQSMKAFTLMVLTECHDPDFQVTEERLREFFSKMEAETFQLRLFEE